MTTKEKANPGKRKEFVFEAGSIALHTSFLLRCAECLIRFLLGAVLSGAAVFSGCAPFGLSLVAASGSGADGFFALLGACVGYLSFFGFVGGLRYVAAAILIFSVSFAFYDIRLYKKVWFMPVAAALLNLITGFVSLTDRGWFTADAVFFLTELLLTGAAVYFYRIAFSSWRLPREDAERTRRCAVSILILGGTLLITLSRIVFLGGISLGRLLATLGVMVFAYKGGLGAGSAAGASAGLAMDLASGGPPFYSMAYAISGLLAGVFQKQGKLFVSVTYVLVSAVSALWVRDHGFPFSILYEVFMASILFIVLPEKPFEGLESIFQRGNTVSGGPLGYSPGRYVQERLLRTSQAFRDVYESMKASFFCTQQNVQNAAAIFDRTAGKVCSKCTLQSACWQRDYVSTFNALNDALPKMQERGRAAAEDFPNYFSSRCIKFSLFLSAVNEELISLAYRRKLQSRIRENRSGVFQQYAQLSQILAAAASEMGDDLMPDPPREKRLATHLKQCGIQARPRVFYSRAGQLRVELEGVQLGEIDTPELLEQVSEAAGIRLRKAYEQPEGRLTYAQEEPYIAVAGIAARRKDGERVSGDCGTYFKSDDGNLFVLICDGMGSGTEANRESALTVRLLEQFLRAGLEPEQALKTLNGALSLRGEETGGFTTIDLLRLNLFTGEASLYKYGAAPTYLRSGSAVRRVAGGSLPAGLCAEGPANPDLSHFTVKPSDCILLVSDGITSVLEETALKEAFSAFREADSPKEFACRLMEESEQQGGSADDRTVLVLRILARS